MHSFPQTSESSLLDVILSLEIQSHSRYVVSAFKEAQWNKETITKTVKSTVTETSSGGWEYKRGI